MIKWSVIIDKLIWLGTLFLFCSFYIFNTSSYSRFILLFITAGIGGLLLIKNSGRIPLYWHSFHTCVFLFMLFCFSSYMWSISPTETLVRTSTILQLFICMSVLYIHYVGQPDTKPLINIIIWGGFIVAVYTFFFYGMNNVRAVVSNAGRLESAFINVNSLGRLMAISSVAVVYQMLFDKFRWYHLLTVLNVLVLAAAGSRTGFIAFMAGVCAVTFVKYSSRNWVMSAVRYFFVALLLLVLVRVLLELPIFEGLKKRMALLFQFFSGEGSLMGGSTTIRHWMIRIGWQKFLEHPLLGNGIASSGEILAMAIGWRTYLHNNYIEMLSGGGLVGTGLYYLLLLWPGWQLFKQRAYRFTGTYFGLILIFLLLMMDYGSVSYSAKNIYFYILLLFIQVQINKRSLKQMNGEKKYDR